jgi:outer membrane protein assembly factor BamB
LRSSDLRATVRPAALALLLVVTGCGADGGGEAGGSGVVRWQGQSDGADGMLVSGDALYVAGPFVVTAFDTDSGEVQWEAEMSDTSGVTPMARDGDVVVVAPEFEGVQAFDARTGEPATYRGEPPSEPYADFELPPGYRYTGGKLRFDGTVVWTGGDPYDPDYAPQVGRLGRMTIVNDFYNGLTVVADDGDVLFHAELGAPMYDESAVLVVAREGVAFTLTADGKLWAVQDPG